MHSCSWQAQCCQKFPAAPQSLHLNPSLILKNHTPQKHSTPVRKAGNIPCRAGRQGILPEPAAPHEHDHSWYRSIFRFHISQKMYDLSAVRQASEICIYALPQSLQSAIKIVRCCLVKTFFFGYSRKSRIHIHRLFIFIVAAACNKS